MEQSPKILIVDDEKDNLDALRRLLRKDFTVFTAESGEEALKLFNNLDLKNLDVVISDQRMPGMQGSELLEHISHLDPVATRILLTGFSDIDAVVDAVNRGQIWRYIAKPWEPEEFKITVKQAAERARMTRTLDESRRELEKAVMEIRAAYWARERLLLLLLHEFKTAPQILEGIKELAGQSADAKTQKKFISNLEGRFNALANEISLFLEEEKKFSQLPRASFSVLDLLKTFSEKNGLAFEGPGFPGKNHPQVLSHLDSLDVALSHFLKILRSNHLKAPVELDFEWEDSEPDAYIILRLQGDKDGEIPLPSGLPRTQSDPKLAWPLLLEPFVGIDPIEQHHSGLRTESARFVRQLNGLGVKPEFQIDSKLKKVELLFALKLSIS